ncbi:MAG: AAA family ATPase [Persephonella sp.]|nr:AAA family ATPase [Persephonella sp.]
MKLGDKPLEVLSPGEKGAILLIFYLMLDKDNIPLIIDQPEENLDNESIFKILVDFIKEVKNRRQLILITHNPNLAVAS